MLGEDVKAGRTPRHNSTRSWMERNRAREEAACGPAKKACKAAAGRSCSPALWKAPEGKRRAVATLSLLFLYKAGKPVEPFSSFPHCHCATFFMTLAKSPQRPNPAPNEDLQISP